jgi:arginine:pyruvate transaminase
VAALRHRQALAVEILSAQTTVGLVLAQGAMYLMLDVHTAGLSGIELANALLDIHRVAVMAGERFGITAAGHILTTRALHPPGRP